MMENTEWKNDQKFAQQLDEWDELRNFRDQFIIPKREGKKLIYFLETHWDYSPGKQVKK